MEEHSAVVDEHLLLEQSNRGAEDREAVNANSKYFRAVEILLNKLQIIINN